MSELPVEVGLSLKQRVETLEFEVRVLKDMITSARGMMEVLAKQINEFIEDHLEEGEAIWIT
jgi:chaperonin cofactor prefoldin